MTPLYLNLEIAIIESTCPTEEFPDSSPKLSIAATCHGKCFSTPWQPISSVENREALVKILMEVASTKIIGSLDMLNDEGVKLRKPASTEWIPIPPNFFQS